MPKHPIRIGIGGWVFPAWNRTFYPRDVRAADHLAWASRRLTAIEINATYHRTQTPESFAAWRAAVPDGFRFTVKAPRWATQTTDPAKAAAFVNGFLASGLVELGDALGPILWQMPPTRTWDKAAWFPALLPGTLGGRPLRHAIEAQHPSWDAAPLPAHATRVMLDLEGEAPPETLPGKTPPAPFRYVRLKGSAEPEPAGYPPATLSAWSETFTAWSRTTEVFAFVIAGAKERAPAAALALIERVS